MAAKKENSSPAFGTVEPPRRRRKGGFTISDETVDALNAALVEASANGDGFIGDNVAYATMGKAQAASQRYRRSLVDAKHIEDVKQVASRVWQDGDDYRFALRLRKPDENESETE